MAMKLGTMSVTISGTIDPELYAMLTGSTPEELELDTLVASLMLEQTLGVPSAIRASAYAMLDQDDDAHDTCTLTACLNPLHPGPCKGWKHSLFQNTPEAWHALEAKRVEKANARRLKKIEELKAKNLPIPKKLLTPIEAKPHPHAGKTANAATGEAHTAGQAVSKAAGVKVSEPGKVTLGQAVKTVPAAPVELGAKGKKPTLASKGVAFVIAQPKVTDQYKLDKADKITPEQWAALSADDKKIIGAELFRIANGEVDPQKKKAVAILNKLGVGTITTPSGKVHQKVELKAPQPAKTGGPAAHVVPTPGKREPLPEPKRPEPAKLGGPAAKTVPTPGKRTPLKTPEPAKTGGPAAKAVPVPGKREPAKLSEVATPKTAVTTVGGKKTGTLTDQILFPEKYYDAKQKAAVAATGAGGNVEDKLIAYRMSGKQFENLTQDHKTAILADLQHVADTHTKPDEAATAQLLHDAYTGEVANYKPHLAAIAIAAGQMKTSTPVHEAFTLNQLSAADIQQLKPAYRNAIAARYGQLLMFNPFDKNTEELGKKISGTSDLDTALHKAAEEKLKAKGVPLVAPATTTTHAIVSEMPKAQPAHVQDAIAMAKGQAPGASWAKHQLPVYQKLSAEEFHALPGPVQDKIVSDLQKGHGKFLDPKKKLATELLLAKIGHPVQGSKFGPGKPEAPEVAPAKIENVDFHTHLTNPNVTEAQAKTAVEATPHNTVQAFAVKHLGLGVTDLPGSLYHKHFGESRAQEIIAQQTAGVDPKVLAHPTVQAKLEDYRKTLALQHYTLSVGKAKNAAFNKTSTELATNKELSPIQRAALKKFEQGVLDYPVNTGSATHDNLLNSANTKSIALNEAIEKVKKTAPSGTSTIGPGTHPLTAVEANSKVKELLGEAATNPKVNLSLAETQAVHGEAVKTAAGEVQGVDGDTLLQPKVASAYKTFLQRAEALYATHEMQSKLEGHLAKHHEKALKSGLDQHGNKLDEAGRQAIHAQRDAIKADWKHLYASEHDQMDKLEQARKGLKNAIQEAEQAKANTPKVTELTDAEAETIAEAYNKGWRNAAYDAAYYGTKSSWSKKQAIKNHPDFQSFNDDFKQLGADAGKVAVAHARAHTAMLGHQAGTVSAKDAQKALSDSLQAQHAFDAQLKQAQAKLDKIREDNGLKKRSLPKLDAAAVKTSAAETGYYKAYSYGGPLSGKPVEAKSYILSKVGPKYGVAHKDYGDKLEEKTAKKAAQTAKIQEQHKGFYEAQAAAKEANAAKKAQLAGTEGNPNQAVADQFGFNYAPNGVNSKDYWEPGSGPAYYTSDEELARLKEHLEKADTKYGIEAQKEFKWSVGNMEGKGASHSQQKAVYSYTGGGYQSVNDKLNSIPPGAPSGSSTIGSIDAAMKASPPLEGDVVLYRGFKNPAGVFAKSGKWNETNVAGMEWSQRSYSSTSGSLSTAQSFGSHGVVMRIIIPKEMQVHGINAKGGQHPGENEIILERGVRYRVIADYGKHGYTRYIDVMVVPNPYAKAQ